MVMTKKWIIATALALLLALFVFLYGDLEYWESLSDALSWEELSSVLQKLKSWDELSPWWTALGFFGVYVFVNTFSIPVATIIALLAGALYGPFYGTMLMSFAGAVGGCFTFLLSRYFLGEWVRGRFPNQLATLEQKWAFGGMILLASMRIQPIFPYVLINLLFGLSPMRLWPFSIVSFFSLMPNTFVVVFAGERLSTLSGPSDIYRIDVLCSLLLLAFLPPLLKKMIKKND
jgi:uncharacterized membrane protein YdjX (TVP38/TMEM64 family)